MVPTHLAPTHAPGTNPPGVYPPGVYPRTWYPRTWYPPTWYPPTWRLPTHLVPTHLASTHAPGTHPPGAYPHTWCHDQLLTSVPFQTRAKLCKVALQEGESRPDTLSTIFNQQSMQTCVRVYILNTLQQIACIRYTTP